MTDRELRRLSKLELVEIIYGLQKERAGLEEEIGRLQKALDDKRLKISSAGSIAEASLQLNGIFEAAQAAADQYLFSLKARTSGEEERV